MKKYSADIAPPRHQGGYLDRLIECQAAMEPAFVEMVARATAAGWGEDEIAEALVELARCHRLAGWESQKSEAALDEAWEQIGEATEH